MSNSEFKEYSNKWEVICQHCYPNFEPLNGFSPLPDDELSFCLHYSALNNNYPTMSAWCLMLKLVKLHDSNKTSSLALNIDVTVCYSDGSPYRKRVTLKVESIQRMDEVYFKEIYFEKEKEPDELLSNNYKLVIECSLKFWNNSTDLTTSGPTSSYVFNKFEHFVKNFNTIYEAGVLSDVKFAIGEKSLPAHKAVIATHSPVFLKMFAHDFKDSQTNIVTITESDYSVFRAFLKYLYTVEIEDQSWSSVSELYRLADKYDVVILKCECQQIIASLLSDDNICDVLILAYDYEDNVLKEKAVQYAVPRMKILISSEAWKSMASSHLRIAYDVTSKCLST